MNVWVLIVLFNFSSKVPTVVTFNFPTESACRAAMRTVAMSGPGKENTVFLCREGEGGGA